MLVDQSRRQETISRVLSRMHHSSPPMITENDFERPALHGANPTQSGRAGDHFGAAGITSLSL